MPHKKQRLIIAAAFLVFLVVAAVAVAAVNWRSAPFKDLPPVAFNFPLSKKETRYSDTSHIYEYDLATKKVTPHFIEGLEWLDADMAAGLVLGRMNDAVVELDLSDDSIRELGPDHFQGQPLEFVRRRPDTEGYCGITENGDLVLWDQVSQEFTLLKTMRWNGYSFGCSWSWDGKQLHIPDETGIGIIDVDTLEETHWLTLSVYYPQINDHGAYKNAFAVSPDQNSVVYCTAEGKLMLANISGDGRIFDEIELGEFSADCAFAILDSDTVVFLCQDTRVYFFTHSYYEIKLYRDGTIYKLKETDWANSLGSGTYVFW